MSYRSLVLETLSNHGIFPSEQMLLYLDSLPLDSCAREVQKIIDSEEKKV